MATDYAVLTTHITDWVGDFLFTQICAQKISFSVGSDMCAICLNSCTSNEGFTQIPLDIVYKLHHPNNYGATNKTIPGLGRTLPSGSMVRQQ